MTRLEGGGSTRRPNAALVSAFEEVKRREAEARARGLPVEAVVAERRRRQEMDGERRRAAAEQARMEQDADEDARRKRERNDGKDGKQQQTTDVAHPLRAWLVPRDLVNRPCTPGPRPEKRIIARPSPSSGTSNTPAERERKSERRAEEDRNDGVTRDAEAEIAEDDERPGPMICGQVGRKARKKGGKAKRKSTPGNQRQLQKNMMQDEVSQRSSTTEGSER